MDKAEKKLDAGGTQSIGRATAILRVLGAAGPDGLGLSEIALQAQMERPTAHRILRRLVEEALVVQLADKRTYRLGPLLYELGLAAGPSIPAQELCSEAMRELSRITGDCSFLIARSGTDSVCFQRHEGHFPIKVLMLGIGQRRPLGCGAGSIALLSLLPDEQIEDILRANRPRLDAIGEPDHTTFRAIIGKAKADGYATKDAPDLPVRTLSMPIVDAHGHGVYALSVTSLTVRMEQRQTMIVTALRQITKELERKIRGVLR
jgi:DNA-binding IclR family transcriptional regulator